MTRLLFDEFTLGIFYFSIWVFNTAWADLSDITYAFSCIYCLLWGYIAWKGGEQSNAVVNELLGKKRADDRNNKNRQLKYFSHIKWHATLMKKHTRGKNRRQASVRSTTVQAGKISSRVGESVQLGAKDKECWRSCATNNYWEVAL